jgi:hypothetical protein
MPASIFERKPARPRQRRKIYFIVTEGERTEKNYFNHLKGFIPSSAPLSIRLEIRPCGKKSDPNHLKIQAESVERDSSFSVEDEIWIVSDVDGRDKASGNAGCAPLNILFNWESGKKHRHVALSNPQFELWLAMHFDRCDGVKTQTDCLDRIKKYIPQYKKNASAAWAGISKIQEAVRNAKLKDFPQCPSGQCPGEGITTVYRLVEKILNHII